MRITDRLPALKYRNYRLFWVGQGISVTGSHMQTAAVLWQVYHLTGSFLLLGLVGLFRVVPIILFSLLGGAVADARDRRRIMYVTQSLLLCTAVILSVLTATGVVKVWMIYGLIAINAAAVSFDNPARQSLVPNLVPREVFSSAVSLNSMVFQVATIIGPVIGGLLIQFGQLHLVYLLNAFSFLAVLVALRKMDPTAFTHQQTERSEVSWAALKEGFAFLRSQPILMWTIALDFTATFFSSATALLPGIAQDVLGVEAKGYGYLVAASGVGSLLAGAITALLPPIRRQGVAILVAVAFYGGFTVLFGAANSFWMAWLALAGVGASDTVSTIIRQTIRQMVTPDRLRGRTTSLNMIFFMGGPQLGELEAGLVAEGFGARVSVISGGLACLLCTAIISSRAKALRNYTAAELGDKPAT